MASQTSARASAKADDIMDKASGVLQGAAAQAQDMVDRVSAQGRETGEAMQEAAGNIKGAVDKSVKDQPMATLAAAAMVGFVLGALWKS